MNNNDKATPHMSDQAVAYIRALEAVWSQHSALYRMGVLGLIMTSLIETSIKPDKYNEFIALFAKGLRESIKETKTHKPNPIPNNTRH